MYFNNEKYNVPSVFHRGNYKVLFKNSLEEIRKDLTFVIEKHCDSGQIKICISDEHDPCFLCVLTVTRNDYDELKKVQGLLVDFDNFPSQLVRLLQQCTSGNLFLTLQQQGLVSIYLDIVEHNEFKRLIHLSLKAGPASDADIKRNMADNIINLKRNLAQISSTLTTKESVFIEREKSLEAKLDDLNVILSRVEEDKFRQENEYQEKLRNERERFEKERLELKQCADMCSKTQINSLQDALGRKEKLLEESTIKHRQLQESFNNLESQFTEKSQRLTTLEKQLHHARTDAETWRNQTGALDRDYHDKEMNLQKLRSHVTDVEKILKEKSEMLQNTSDLLQSTKREKISLEEKLNSCEVTCSKLQMDVSSINDQLLKANQIISRQNTDLINLREKLMCRTAIALEQEKVIERHSREITGIQEKEKELLENIDRLKKENEKLLSERKTDELIINEKEETIKNNNTVIQWLHKKLEASQSTEDFTGQKHRVASLYSSTPFMSVRSNSEKSTGENNNDLLTCYTSGINRKSPSSAPSNRYTSQESGLSNGSSANAEENKYRVDPKYLKPTEYPTRSSSSKSHGTWGTSDGEEHKYSVDPVYLRPSEYSTRGSARSKSQDSLPKRTYGLKDSDRSSNPSTANKSVPKTPHSGQAYDGAPNSRQSNDKTPHSKYRNTQSPVSAYFPSS